MLLLALMAFLSPLSNLNAAEVFTLSCPDDVVLYCGDEIWDLTSYGKAYYTDYSGTHSAGDPSVHYYLNSCNTGHIIRTWTVEDEYWNIHTCSQTIIVYGGFFTYTDIQWPEPIYELNGCDPDTDPKNFPPEYGPPTYNYVNCSQIGINYDDETFNFGPDCKKILRTWTVIDWCTYHPQNNPGKGKWSFTQTIKISAVDEPVVACLPDITVSSFNCENAYVTLSDLVAPNSTCGGTYVVSHNSIYADTTGSNASGFYPKGITEIRYSLTYGCGSNYYCKQKITVLDQKGPVPYCYGSLTVALMAMDDDNDGIPEDGMVEIWAKDLDVGSYHPCGREPLKFSFSPDVDSTFRVFTCDEVGSNLIRMYVTDTYGNQSYCLVDVVVQNNGANIPNCDANSTVVDDPVSYSRVEGSISNKSGDKIENSYLMAYSTEVDTQIIEDIDLRQYSYSEEIIDSFYNTVGAVVYNKIIDSTYIAFYDTIMSIIVLDGMTDQNGNFVFDSIPNHKDFKIEATKIGMGDNIIDYKDVRAVLDHLTGVKVFQSPYEYIAADINFDNEINLLDLKALLSYVQGDSDQIPLDKRWQFVDAAYNFESDNCLTENYPEYLMHLKAAENTLNFKAICTGDVSEYKTIYDFELADLSQEISKDIRSLENNQVVLKASFSPNPFTDKSILQLEGLITQNLKLEIFDHSGKLVIQSNVSDGFEVTQIYKAGLYFYRITSENQVISGKIIKQ